MAKNSNIEWTNHTFNPWWGCTKVSPACEHCYAETWAKRLGHSIWGSKAHRRHFSDAHWANPLKWNEEALSKGLRYRVFCASMADVFEDRKDLNADRKRLWQLIENTQALDWLLLTKRPHLVKTSSPWTEHWPDNVWLGTTVENQEWVDKRLPYLLENKAKVKFLSCEPLLGKIDLSRYVKGVSPSPIHWIIAGGESGRQSRPMHASWARNLRDFCRKNGISFHFKQWGHWVPVSSGSEVANKLIVTDSGEKMVALGKKKAGRILDGQTYDELPKISML